MKTYLTKLYRYNQWANRRVMKAVRAQSVEHERIRTLLSHVAVAENIWLHRVKGLPKPDLKLWDALSIDRIEELFTAADAGWIEYAEQSQDFSTELHYTNYTGLPFTNTIEAIMIHTANHATYHRAQVAMLLRDNGFEPANTDFITYDRVLRGELPD